MASALPVAALARRTAAGITASAPRAAAGLAAGLPQHRTLTTSTRLPQRQGWTASASTTRRTPPSSASSTASAASVGSSSSTGAKSSPSSTSSASASSSSTTTSTSQAASSSTTPSPELFNVYTPSSRASQTIPQHINALAARKRAAPASASEAAAAAAGDADASGEDATSCSVLPGGGPNVPFAGSAGVATRRTRRFLHGQLNTPSTFTPLSEIIASPTSASASSPGTGTSSTPQRPQYRAKPLLGPPAALAKRLDPFHKLSLNPAKPSLADDSYKNGSLLIPYMSEMGRILPRSRTGLTRKGQRQVGKAIRRARSMGLLPVFSRGAGRTSGFVWK